jgi:hypothetical protein
MVMNHLASAAHRVQDAERLVYVAPHNGDAGDLRRGTLAVKANVAVHNEWRGGRAALGWNAARRALARESTTSR